MDELAVDQQAFDRRLAGARHGGDDLQPLALGGLDGAAGALRHEIAFEPVGDTDGAAAGISVGIAIGIGDAGAGRGDLAFEHRHVSYPTP